MGWTLPENGPKLRADSSPRRNNLPCSKLYISEGNKRFRHKSEQGICRNVSGNRIQLSAPCSIDPWDVRGPCVLAGENPNCSRCSTQFKGIAWHNLSKFRS